MKLYKQTKKRTNERTNETTNETTNKHFHTRLQIWKVFGVMRSGCSSFVPMNQSSYVFVAEDLSSQPPSKIDFDAGCTMYVWVRCCLLYTQHTLIIHTHVCVHIVLTARGTCIPRTRTWYIVIYTMYLVHSTYVQQVKGVEGEARCARAHVRLWVRRVYMYTRSVWGI